MTKTRRDWLGYAATAFALVVTFNAEYEIALACHINQWVAYAVPGALDVYVLRALQVKRDVLLTVLAMILVNAASHLVAAGVLAVSPALIVSVSAIAPLVLWRAHVLKHEASMPDPAQSMPASDEHAEEDQFETCPWCAYDGVPSGRIESHQEHACSKRWEHASSTVTLDEHAAQAEAIANPGTVNVPEHAPSMPEPYDLFDGHARWGGAPATWNMTALPPLPAGWDGTVEEHAPRMPAVLTLVTDPPAGMLLDGDKEFLDRARDYWSTCSGTPSLNDVKANVKVGTDRARRLRAYLELETEEQS